MVKQSQEYQLAVPIVCSTALLIRRLSASECNVSHSETFRALWLPYVFTSIDPRLDETYARIVSWIRERVCSHLHGIDDKEVAILLAANFVPHP
jgi:hypothetical protein